MSLHLAISFWQRVLLSFSLSAHAHTYTHTNTHAHRHCSISLFPPFAIMLLGSTHWICGTQNVSGGEWTSGDGSNLKYACHQSQFVLLWPRMHYFISLTFYRSWQQCILEIWYLKQILMRREFWPFHFPGCSRNVDSFSQSLEETELRQLMGPQFSL